MNTYIEDLLEELKLNAIYSDKVSLPIPVYEKMRRALKELDKHEKYQVAAIKEFIGKITR